MTAKLKAPRRAKEREENFQQLYEEIVTSSKCLDVYLTQGHTEIWLYLDGDSGFNLALRLDGTWDLQ